MVYKKLLKELGIGVTELANVLFISAKTLDSWLARGSSIPLRYSGYFSALERYLSERKAEEVELVGKEWAETDRERIDEQKTAAMKDLNVAILRCAQKLERLKQTESRLLSQGHLAANYSRYLETSLRENEETKAWLSLLGRKSKFEYSDIRREIRHCEQQLAGLKAQADYWTS